MEFRFCHWDVFMEEQFVKGGAKYNTPNCLCFFKKKNNYRLLLKRISKWHKADQKYWKITKRNEFQRLNESVMNEVLTETKNLSRGNIANGN